jgi:hypothetical protein
LLGVGWWWWGAGMEEAESESEEIDQWGGGAVSRKRRTEF